MLPNNFKDARDKNDFFIALFVIALAGGFIVYYSLFNPTGTARKGLEIGELVVDGKRYHAIREKESIQAADLSEEIDFEDRYEFENFAEKKPDVVETPAQTKIVPVAPVADISDANDETTDAIDEDEMYLHPEESELGNDQIEIDENQTGEISSDEPFVNEDSVEMGDGNIIPRNSDTTITEIAETSEITEPNTEKIPAVTPEPDTSSERGDCIILIGAFNKKSSILALKKQLLKEGYDIFETPYKGYTRIGIYHPCNPRISTTLKSIRRKYASDAFILKH